MDEILEKSILQTIAYFDVFEFPLTREELERWLWQSNQKIQPEQLEQLQYLEHKDAFYFLSRHSDNVDKRQLAVPGFERKLKIARRAAKKLRWIPFCRAVFVCNSAGTAMIGEESDIDVFIITKAGRIWLVRFFATIILQLWRLRLRGDNVKDKICLSFYTTDNNLDLSHVSLSQPDIYMIYWLDHLIPIYDPDNLRKEILQANAWAKKYLPNAFKSYKLASRLQVTDNKISKLFKDFFTKIWSSSYGDILETQAKKIQKAKMNKREELKNKPANHVVISDQMLKFHENDRRSFFREQWLERCKKIGV